MSNHNNEMMDRIEQVWNELSYEQKEAATAKVFQAIRECIDDPDYSFRGLIYGLLNFEPQSYTPLYLSGGMVITNYIGDTQTEKT